MSAASLIWGLIAAIGLTDVLLMAAQGMTIRWSWPVAGFILLLYGISIALRRRNAAAARLAEAFAQIFAFGQVGGWLSYLATAASPFPLADHRLADWDAALGFDWPAWYQFVQGHPALHTLLSGAYRSIPTQLLVMICWLCYADSRRVDELLIATILTVLPTICLMFLLPAIGAWAAHGVAVGPWEADTLALRSHTMIRIDTVQGIITFPSFHTSCGVLLASMARGRYVFPLVALINAVMIVSVLTEGGHFAVDLLSGLAVAGLGIAAARWLLARFAYTPHLREASLPISR